MYFFDNSSGDYTSHRNKYNAYKPEHNANINSPWSCFGKEAKDGYSSITGGKKNKVDWPPYFPSKRADLSSENRGYAKRSKKIIAKPRTTWGPLNSSQFDYFELDKHKPNPSQDDNIKKKKERNDKMKRYGKLTRSKNLMSQRSRKHRKTKPLLLKDSPRIKPSLLKKKPSFTSNGSLYRENKIQPPKQIESILADHKNLMPREERRRIKQKHYSARKTLKKESGFYSSLRH
eukprot:snap_masked-scaffold_2-processed-gene-19.20-mRNA-1 protein AED:1.00 eAED:1.00 QI:0/-1/0/0/-1/1/1/0/231